FFEPASIARRYSTLERRSWDPNRELVSQGVASLAAGIGGGFPAGGSFTRTALMRDWGARTRLSGVITGLTVLLLLPLLPLLARLPNAALGAIVMVSVRELIRIRPFREYRRYTRLQFRIALATLALTVALAPRVEWAIVIGVAMSIGAHLTRELRLSVSASAVGDTLHLYPKGVLYFFSAPRLENAVSVQLSAYPEARRLVLHLDGLGRVDVTGALALRRLLEEAGEAGLEVALADIPPQAAKIVARVIDGYGLRR
ncbi:MAG: SulP family inorganic anion transporter, partial [Acidimicrobiia bacterium]